MQPPKEILIEVKEDKDYDERVFAPFLFNAFILFVVVVIAFNAIDSLLGFFMILTLGVGYVWLNIFNVKKKNSYFIYKLSVNPNDTLILYKFKQTDVVTFLQGKTSDFGFKIKVNASENSKYAPHKFISISYQGKEVIRQFEIDNWARQDIEQIVRDICLIKGDEFWISPFQRAVQSSGRKFVRLIFPKFNFD
jgi:hypothetical protein